MTSWLALALLAAPADAPISLIDMLRPSAIVPSRQLARIAGRAALGSREEVLERVARSLGVESRAKVRARDGAFACRYPVDFAGAPPLEPCVLFIDATLDPDFDPRRPEGFEAEAALIVVDLAGRRIPDLPSSFTNDLLD